MADASAVGDAALIEDLRARVRGEVRPGEPLARHTTLRVGGPAAALVVAETPEDLEAVAQVCGVHDRGWLIIGRGSNLLVADQGWAGVAVLLGTAFRGVDIDGHRVVAGGAEPMPALAAQAAKAGLGGLAFGVAIPGSVGGAVRMNAGAHGGETSRVLEWAEAARLRRGGAVERFTVEGLAMGYRHTALPDDAVVVRAGFVLEPRDQATLAAEMQEMQRWRREHQPLSEPTCGSVFANPEGDSAGRLIEAAGMKGHQVGGARVSTKHANFIVGGLDATAADVYRVLKDVQDAVARVHGVALRPEVVLVGFAGEQR